MRKILMTAVAAIPLAACGGSDGPRDLESQLKSASGGTVSESAFLKSCAAYYTVQAELDAAPKPSSLRKIYDQAPDPSDIPGSCACLYENSVTNTVEMSVRMVESTGKTVTDAMREQLRDKAMERVADQHRNFLRGAEARAVMSETEDYDMAANMMMSDAENKCRVSR